MKGLIIKTPWIDYILEGKKDWEIRGNNTSIRGRIQLIQSGTGMIVGEVDLIDSFCLDERTYMCSTHHHMVVDVNRYPYKRTYAWVLKNPKRYNIPKPYRHPMGAVIWVNLPD